MNTINNLLTNLNLDLNLTKKKPDLENNSDKCIDKNPYQNDTKIPSLSQGYKFKEYQNQIYENTEKKMNVDFTKEGFQSQVNNMASVREEYNKTLAEYKNLLNSISKSIANNVERISTSNPYLNKFIRFSDSGAIYYVTKKGVAKYVPSTNILNSIGGKNGCPDLNYIDIKIPWSVNYNVPGEKIPTNPPLIVGTEMKKRQSCGYEGSNVYVNSMIPNSQTTYKGCFQDNATTPAMKLIGEKNLGGSQNNIIANGDFSQPVIANDTYKYLVNHGVPGWVFNAVLLNNSGAWLYPMPYPNGNQCVSIQRTHSISQTVNLIPGNYTLSFYSVGRNCCDGSGQSNLVNIQLNGTTIYSVQPPVDKWTQYSKTFNVTNRGNNEIKFQGTWKDGDRSSAFQNIYLAPR
jgi:hypothetical protein